MLVEILKVDLGNGPTRVIAIQYAFDDVQMESKMRAACALFDCIMPGMSNEMHRSSPVSHGHFGARAEMNDVAIRKVMDQFGMDYIQARNHLKCQALLPTAVRPFAIAPVTHSRIEPAAANVRHLSDYRTVDGSQQDMKT